MADYTSDNENEKTEDETDATIIENAKLVRKLDDMFMYSLDHPTWISARKDMVKCHEYSEGRQWTDAELEVLKERKQPDSVNNLVAVTVNKLVGELVDQKVRIGFRGRNAQADDESAQLLSDIFLYIRQANDLEFEERDMARDGFTGGFGVLDAFVTFDDMSQPEIVVRSEDSLAVFPDPDAKRYDWNEDAKYVCRAKWMDADEAEQKYPKAKAAINTLVTNATIGAIAGGQLAEVEQFRNDHYVDQKRRRVRLVEVQYKKYNRECIYLTASGDIIPEAQWNADVKKQLDAAQIAYEKIDRIKPKICFALYAAGTLIENKETNRKYFSLVPYFAYRKKNGAPYSLITLALSVQDAINKRDSKALHLLNSNQTIAERGAIKEVGLYQEEIAKPDGVAIVEDGALAQEKMILRNNLELSQGQQQMHQGAIGMFYAITGINPNAYQQTGEIRSGSGLQKKFSEANKPIAALFDNLKRTRKILGRVLLDLVQNYYTQEKVFMVTDAPDKAERAVTITADKMAKVKQMNYDVTADDFVDTSSVQQEQWALFMQYLPNLLPLGPYWVKKAIQTSDLRDKDQLVADLDAQSGPPPVQPRISVQANINELPPIERAFFYRSMGNEELAAQVEAAGTPASGEIKASVELSKAIMDADAKEADRKVKRTEGQT